VLSRLAPGPGIRLLVTLHGVLIGDDGQRTRSLAALLADGVLSPVISHLLPLSDAEHAHRLVEDRHSGGKIVLTVTG